MCEVLVIGSQHDVDLLHAADAWLRRAGIAVEVAEVTVARADPARRRLATVVAIVPEEGDPERGAILDAVRRAIRCGTGVVAVARPGDRIPLPPRSLLNVVRMGGDPHGLRCRLLESVIEPGPFRCLVVPGITAPSGIAAWSSTQVVVSCDDSGRVVAVDAATGRAITLVDGLLEPHGVAVDRRTLLVAAKGSNSVVTGELVDGRLSPRRELGHQGPPALAAPHHAMQLGGHVVIVDTDNHRLLHATGHVLGRLGRFERMAVGTTLRHPCGGTFVPGGCMVADTFNDRLVLVRDGQTLTHPALSFPAPVQVATAPNGVLAVVATDGLHLVAASVDHAGAALSVRTIRHVPAGGGHPLRNPFGVAVDRAGKVFVADRGRGVVWFAELSELLAEGHRDAA